MDFLSVALSEVKFANVKQNDYISFILISASTDKFQTLSRESIGYNITPESYQCDRDATSNNQCLTSNANSPAGGSSQLLRHLLQGPQEPSQSASTFLRSIVQNINNRGTNQEIERKSSSASMRLMSLNRGDIALNSDGNRTSGNDGVTSSGCLASLLTKVQQPIPRKKQRNNDAQQGVSLLSVTSSSLNKQQQQQNLLYPVTIDEKVRNDGDEGYGRKEGSEHSLGEEDSQITGIKWRRKTPSTSSLSSDQSHDATTQWLKHYLQPSGNESGTVLSERRAMTMPSSSRRQNVTGSLRVMQSRRCIVRDVATQCEKETKFVAGNSSETVVVGEAQEGQGTHGSLSCMHCGLIFDDEVIHSIHMGCHNHADPYVCNVCGRHCNNRYGFYTHIMRGHYVNS